MRCDDDMCLPFFLISPFGAFGLKDLSSCFLVIIASFERGGERKKRSEGEWTGDERWFGCMLWCWWLGGG